MTNPQPTWRVMKVSRDGARFRSSRTLSDDTAGIGPTDAVALLWNQIEETLRLCSDAEAQFIAIRSPEYGAAHSQEDVFYVRSRS